MEFISENITSEGYLSGQTLNVGYATITNLNVIDTVTLFGTVYSGNPITDFYVTGGTYSNGTLTLDRQNGSVIINGFFTGGTSSGVDTYVTGVTFNELNRILTISQNQGQPNLTAIISDNYVTGGTLIRTTDTLILNRQNGSIIITGVTDTFITGFTYNDNNVITLSQNEGQPNLSITINQMSGLTISGLTSTGSLTVRNGAAAGYILTSDSFGGATWQPSPVGSGATKLDLQSITASATTTSTNNSATWVDVGSMTLTAKNLGSSATTYTVSFSCTASLSNNAGVGNIRLVLNNAYIFDSQRSVTNAGAAMAGTSRELSTIGSPIGVKNGDVIKVQVNSPTGQMTITNRTLSLMGVLTLNLV